VPSWLPFKGVVIIIVSGELWKSNGRRSCHSKEEAWWLADTVLRCLVKASHRIKMNNIKATKDIIDPIDEMTFHFIMASG
jgi:hypothetical protein